MKTSTTRHAEQRRRSLGSPWRTAIAVFPGFERRLSRRLEDGAGSRFKLSCAKPPLALPRFTLRMVAPNAALQDIGMRWLIETLEAVGGGVRRQARQRDKN